MAIKSYYLVRHAEKQSLAAPDTPLSEFGRQRAIALRELLLPKTIHGIIVSPFKRTQQTARPLATAIHVEPFIMANEDIEKILEQMDRHNDLLLVGHTDNIPAIIEKITGETIIIPENDFDNLFVITLAPNKKRLTQMTYGAPSP